jgi:hypothetical protein
MTTVSSMLPERRRHPRTRLQMTLRGIRLDPDGGDVSDTLRMVDISRSGMGAVFDRWLYPGQRLVLCLPLHEDGGRRNINASVRRCTKVAEGYRVGLQFDLDCLQACEPTPELAAAA